jgi:pantetheine-phosphate adenylyltransferase
MRRAIYPGNFDPVTNGHLDIIERASSLFDEVIVAVGVNVGKNPLFTIEERLEMLRESCRHLANVSVDSFDDLTVRYAASRNANVIIRGLRALSDFEYEFEMSLMNRRLDGGVETVFLVTSAEYSYLSSSIIKEIAGFGASVEGLAPKIVEEHLNRKLGSIPHDMRASGLRAGKARGGD